MMTKNIPPFAVALAICATLGVALRAHAAPAESADQAKPLGVGAAVPDAIVKTAAGKKVALKEAVSGTPTVLIFYRGGWCPFCTRHLGALAKSQAELTGLGYQILAISADAPEDLPATSEKHKLGYTLLSDADMKASDAFGLAFYLDDATAKRYDGRFELPVRHAGRYWVPVPAVYLVGKDGHIAFVHTDPDYRQRLPIEDLLKTARAPGGKTAAK